MRPHGALCSPDQLGDNPCGGHGSQLSPRKAQGVVRPRSMLHRRAGHSQSWLGVLEATAGVTARLASAICALAARPFRRSQPCHRRHLMAASRDGVQQFLLRRELPLRMKATSCRCMPTRNGGPSQVRSRTTSKGSSSRRSPCPVVPSGAIGWVFLPPLQQGDVVRNPRPAGWTQDSGGDRADSLDPIRLFADDLQALQSCPGDKSCCRAVVEGDQTVPGSDFHSPAIVPACPLPAVDPVYGRILA